MSNISNAFKNGKAFIGFVTAGDPDFDSSLEIMTAMANGGCDLIEIGIPFSDPIAEGPVIPSRKALPPIKFLNLQKSSVAG